VATVPPPEKKSNKCAKVGCVIEKSKGSNMSSTSIVATLFIAAFGGFVGTMVRQAVGLFLGDWSSPTKEVSNFPAATFVVNLVGCFILGLLTQLSAQYNWDPAILTFFGTGFCGGLTTFSTFTIDTLKLSAAKNHGTAALYVVSTILGGFLTAYIGWVLGQL
jgi:fluoride exporter